MKYSHSISLFLVFLCLCSLPTRGAASPQAEESAHSSALSATKEASHLELAALCSDATRIKDLENALKAGADPNTSLAVPSYLIAEHLNGQTSRILETMNVNDETRTSAQEAMPEISNKILSAKEIRMSLLSFACSANNPEAIRLLLKYGANVNVGITLDNETWSTPLHDAILGGNIHGTEVIPIMLLEAGASPNIRAQGNATPLHIAASMSSPSLVDKLLKAGATPDKMADNNLTPLMLSCVAGRAENAEVLLQTGRVNPNAMDTGGLTPLHYACISGDCNCIRLLLRKGARGLQKTDKEGNTPLHYAVFYEHTDCVRLLIALGADCTVQNNEHESPLDFAESTENSELIQLMKEEM